MNSNIIFEEFGSIERWSQNIVITEKIHGTNSQILVTEQGVFAGSRTRWVTPEDDNYGFARWVKDNETELANSLGLGQHFGEWYGKGINAGYNLTEKRFALFNSTRWTPVKDTLPPRVDVVPILYEGPQNSTVVEETFNTLKLSGSILVPGYPKPEGIVIWFDRSRMHMKRTFESEDEAWNYKAPKPDKPGQAEIEEICRPFWHPLRLEKILSRDETFVRSYPESLPNLVKTYIADLEKESVIEIDPVVLRLVKKNAFKAIKGMMQEKGYST